jgi:hypothetical protein
MKITFMLGFICETKQKERRIEITATVVPDSQPYQLIIGRTDIKEWKLVKRLPSHFMKMSFGTSEMFALRVPPLTVPMRSTGLGPTYTPVIGPTSILADGPMLRGGFQGVTTIFQEEKLLAETRTYSDSLGELTLMPSSRHLREPLDGHARTWIDAVPPGLLSPDPNRRNVCPVSGEGDSRFEKGGFLLINRSPCR